MRRVLLRLAIKLNKERKRRRNLQKIIQAMAAVVVFCTTYALILPAITMEQEYLCGLQTHTHEDRCYESYPYYDLSCSFAETPGTMVLHSHVRDCYDREGVLRCQLPDRPAHVHEDACYGEPEILCGLTEEQAHVHSDSCTKETVLICQLKEGQIHLHDTTCSRQEKVLTCTLPETEGHVHSESCVTVQQVLICTQEEIPGHIHSEACSGTQQNLICGQAEAEGHTHGEGCSDADGNLICTTAEGEGHSHGEGCYETVTLNCDLEETEGHSHSEGCYEMQSVPCSLEEAEAHSHSDSCYKIQLTGCSREENVPHTHADACYQVREVTCPIEEGGGHSHKAECFGERKLSCGKEEIRPHHHDENCYDAKGAKVCQLPETVEHIHGESCLTDTGETVRKLICIREEHEHEDICYADEMASELEYLCGYGEHTHTEECFDEAGQVLCTVPEHTHTAVCVMTDLDLSADTETMDVWDAMFRDMPMTGNWPEDLVAVAQSQLNYRESKRNCALEDQNLKGYSRYGARYELPYADWDSLFVRFCMDYAGIRYYPWQDSAPDWIAQLRQQTLFQFPETYTPKPGDLIFFCRDLEALSAEGLTLEEKLLLADHAGIVTAYIPETEETPAMVRTIEGDVKDRVCNVTYEAQDLRILGYGQMLPGFATEMGSAGEDFTVALSFTPEAQIPMNARLTVREILPEEDYETYYRQSVDSLLERTAAEDEQTLGITFARFFDISFYVGAEQIEPAAPVDVQIRYAQPIAVKEEQSGSAVHFADTGIEVLSASLSGSAVPAEIPAGSEETVPRSTEETAPKTTEETIPQTTEATLPEETERTVHIDTFAFTQNSFSVVGTVLANARVVPATVWLDGTCGGLMAFGDSENRRVQLEGGRLPTTWKSPTKYNYVLKGWYDVTNKVYYPLVRMEDGTLVGPVADVPNDTVFYADWVAASYNIGQPNNYTVDSLDTSEFVTTHMFDYNTLFNLQSVRLTDSWRNSGGHGETWTLVEQGDGTPTHNGNQTLDFVFRDHDAAPELSHPRVADGNNTRNEPTEFNAIYRNIYTANLGNLLFDPTTQVLGKTYLGQGNYLFQYNDNASSDYYGYYYYDSSQNAASYNAGEGRFYVYDYKVYTQDNIGNDLDDTNADFLPLNYPPSGTNLNQQIVYASQENQDPATMANLHFGMSTNIHFYLPNDAGQRDSNGNYLNKSTTGKPMVFEFSGDDDVWVLLDGKLLLDVGGIHQVRSGIIDFSEGVVRTTRDTSTNLKDMETRTFAEILGSDNPVKEGPHNLTVYYLERGGSMSNCAIYFNLAPRYGLDLTKKDFITGQPLEGVEFKVYNDVACQQPATLWPSHDMAKEDNQGSGTQYTTNSFITDENGYAHMWGLVAGKTYYIKETKVPNDNYPLAEALIRVTLNNHGTDISEVTVIRQGTNTQGFEITFHAMDKEHHLISLGITNKKITDPLTALRVEKYWGQGTTVLEPVKVRLMADGQPRGESVTLSADNAWGHTWMDLPLYDASDRTIRYTVEEYDMEGAYTVKIESGDLTLQSDRVDWVKVGALENGSVFYLALDGSNALTGAGGFGTTSLENAPDNPNAHWTAYAYADGFRLRSSGGQYLTFNNDSPGFYLAGSIDEYQNQTFYYDGTHLFVMSNNVRYYVAGGGNGYLNYSTSGDATGIYKKVVTKQGTALVRITNTPIPEERQRPLRVEKFWDGNYPEMPESIRIHVKKDGDIQATLELNQANGWKGTFEGLDSDLLESGGYTLEEELPFGFTPEFSEIQRITIDQWTSGTLSSLEVGKMYAFITNNRALADENGTPRATWLSGNPNDYQKWQVVQTTVDGKTIQALRNVATGRYLREYGESQYVHHFTLVDHADGNCHMRLVNRNIQFYPQSGNNDGWSIIIDSNGYITREPAWGTGGTQFTVRRNDYQAEFRVTVTNTYATYVLPETGGMGTAHYYTFGGLLTAAALMYMIQPKRRRQKGGR